jgi:hypothetical protein
MEIETMRLTLFLVAIVALQTTVNAQTPARHEFAFGYSYATFQLPNAGEHVGLNGMQMDYSWSFRPWLAAVADLSLYYRCVADCGLTPIDFKTTNNASLFTAGVRIKSPNQHTVAPFAQVLAGGSVVSFQEPFAPTARQTKPAILAGGGVTWRIGRFNVRPQVDNLWVPYGRSSNHVRVSGLVGFRWGNRPKTY